MENGDKERLRVAMEEIARMRPKQHEHSSHLTELHLRVAALEKDGGKTNGVLDRARDWTLGALFLALLYMILHFGLPIK